LFAGAYFICKGFMLFNIQKFIFIIFFGIALLMSSLVTYVYWFGNSNYSATQQNLDRATAYSTASNSLSGIVYHLEEQNKAWKNVLIYYYNKDLRNFYLDNLRSESDLLEKSILSTRTTLEKLGDGNHLLSQVVSLGDSARFLTEKYNESSLLLNNVSDVSKVDSAIREDSADVLKKFVTLQSQISSISEQTLKTRSSVIESNMETGGQILILIAFLVIFSLLVIYFFALNKIFGFVGGKSQTIFSVLQDLTRGRLYNFDFPLNTPKGSILHAVGILQLRLMIIQNFISDSFKNVESSLAESDIDKAEKNMLSLEKAISYLRSSKTIKK